MSDNHDLLNDNNMCSFEEHEAENVCSNKDAVAYRKYCGIGAENSIMTVYIADFCVRAVGIRVICWLSICWIRISKQIMSAERIGEKQMRIEKSLYD